MVKNKVYFLLSGDTILQGLLGATTSNPKVYFFYPLEKIENNLPCITYHFTEQPVDEPNIIDKALVDGLLTIDIWSRGNTDEIESRIKEIIKNTLKFKANLLTSVPLFEADLKINHQQLLFQILGG